MQAAAPAVRILADQLERGWLAADRESEQLLGLLLRSEARKFGEFRVNGVSGGLRCCRSDCVCNLARLEFGPDRLEAAKLKTGGAGKGRQNQECENVPAQETEREGAGFPGKRIVRSCHELSLGALGAEARRSKLEVAGRGNNGTGSQPSGTRGQAM